MKPTQQQIKMRGLFEYGKKDVIANQMIMAETFHKMKNMISSNENCLNYESSDYVTLCTEALHSLWNLFEDNHTLLSEADLKEDEYFTEDVYKKVKEQYLYVIAVLPVLKRVSDREGYVPSPRDQIIRHQRYLFYQLSVAITSTDIDEITTEFRMNANQFRFHNLWHQIKVGHWEIRQFHTLLPDVTYEHQFMRYKNMYDTTQSLLNYKTDTVSNPVYRIIPPIGIPTWRMFEDKSDIPAFALKSIAWEKLSGLSEMVRSTKITEGEKRQLLIRAFLTYQKSRNSVDNLDSVTQEPITEEVD